MPIFPKIQSPCPYRSELSAVMEGDFCRMCRRNVVDLSAMGDGERRAFLAGCEEEVCVSYRLPLRPALAAAALAAAAIAAPAGAQEAPAVDVEVSVDSEPTVDEEMLIMVGGIKDPRKVELIESAADLDLPELPVAYEDGPMPAAEEDAPARDEAPAGLSSRSGS